MAGQKRGTSASGEGAGGKKPKVARVEQTQQHGQQKQASGANSQKAGGDISLSKAMTRNYWWRSKEMKKAAKSGTAVAKNSQASKEAGVTQKPKAPSQGARSEPALDKKKRLHLKKKRQLKSRLMRKKKGKRSEGGGGDAEQTTSGQSTKSKKKTKPKIDSASKKDSRDEPSAKSKSKASTGSKTHDPDTASSSATEGQSQNPGLQKQGGKKRRKTKRAKKFKKVTTPAEGGPMAGEKAGESPNASIGGKTGEAAGGKEAATDGTEAAVVNDKAAATNAGPNTEDGVSANWKALLPIVEKSKLTSKPWHPKSAQDGKVNAPPKPRKPDIWFDDVDPSLIRANESAKKEDSSDDESETAANPLLRKDAKDCLTKCLAMDCEMVGTGPRGSQSILARVSVVNQYGSCVLDKYVNPREPVTDYRTFVSGIRPSDLKEKGEDFDVVQKELADILKGRIVVGHALHNDFKVLYFSHPRSMVRDTSSYQPFKELFKSKRPGLKKLTELVLKVKVQKGEHNSVEDAQAAMKLYMLHRKEWEKSLREKVHGPAHLSAKNPTQVKNSRKAAGFKDR